MSTTYWLLVVALIHTLLLAAAVVAVYRVGVYSLAQGSLQIAIALFVPILGAVAVLFMAKEAMAEPAKPDESRFDPPPGDWG